MAKQKFYVVWHGRKKGVFHSWKECNEQVGEFPGAKFKSFETEQLAEEAYRGNSSDFIGKKKAIKQIQKPKLKVVGSPILESISVDGAWNTATGKVEYQGVYTKTKEKIFHQGPFEDGTNNIVEFLGIVHALAFCKKKNIASPIYSDSKTAMSWVKRKNAGTKHERNNKNEKLFKLLDKAVVWLNQNEYPNQVLKWETGVWGENPADFGRK